jgi:hypothetical protein
MLYLEKEPHTNLSNYKRGEAFYGHHSKNFARKQKRPIFTIIDPREKTALLSKINYLCKANQNSYVRYW